MIKYHKLISLYHLYKALFTQLFRYGIVGLIAAMVHFAIVVCLVQLFAATPLMANMFAYPCSFQVSYWGHRLWTFDGTTASHINAFPKLVMIQLINFCIGQSLYYIFLKMHIPYQLGLLIVLMILPIFTFISSRLWVFTS